MQIPLRWMYGAVPAEMGFETYESELNEFSGGGPSGEWRIVVNTESKIDYSDYTLTIYADLPTQANGTVIEQDGNGNYFFTHTNDSNPDKVYKLHTSVWKGADRFYPISFYCLDTTWDNYNKKLPNGHYNRSSVTVWLEVRKNGFNKMLRMRTGNLR